MKIARLYLIIAIAQPMILTPMIYQMMELFKMQLYTIADNYKNLAELLLNPEFSENKDVIAALDKVEDDFKTKAVQVGFVIRNLEGDVDTIQAEIERLNALKTARANNIERLKEYLKFQMKTTGITKVDSPLLKLSFSTRVGASVEFEGNTSEERTKAEQAFIQANSDTEYVKWGKPSVNKTELKLALKRGVKIEGVHLADSYSLTIK